jgi:uncharacterized damage-inducible protein DinB
MRALTVLTLLSAMAIPSVGVAQAKAAKAKAAPKTVSGIRADVLKDLDAVEKKFLQLATAMAGKYSWRPADKVRSVGEVFMHVAGENYALPMVLGTSVKPPEDFKASNMNEAFGSAAEMEKITDEAAIKAEIEASFAHIKKAVSALRDSDLNTPVSIFGMNTTKRGFLLLINNHMHEHLGQVIAYARMNGVAPPWSAQSGG